MYLPWSLTGARMARREQICIIICWHVHVHLLTRKLPPNFVDAPRFIGIHLRRRGKASSREMCSLLLRESRDEKVAKSNTRLDRCLFQFSRRSRLALNGDFIGRSRTALLKTPSSSGNFSLCQYHVKWEIQFIKTKTDVLTEGKFLFFY